MAASERTLYRHGALAQNRRAASNGCDMGWTLRIVMAVAVLLVLGAGALAIYAGNISPPHRTYEQVISNDRFPG